MSIMPTPVSGTAPSLPHFQIAKDHAARTQRLLELKIRQFESTPIANVKAHDLADLIKACQTEIKVGKHLETNA